MIRDRLVVGIHDKKLPERLQFDADLTLEKAVTSVRQSDMIHQQQSLLHGEETKQNPIDAVQTFKKTMRNDLSSGRESGQFDRSTLSKSSRCGRIPNHSIDECSGKGMTCRS